MKNNCKLRKVTEHGRLVFNGGEKMVQIEDKDSALIGAIEICGELQSELAYPETWTVEYAKIDS